MDPDGSADLAPNTDDTTYCARHPQVETTLACSRCGTLICPRCLVQTPVGTRCRECAGVTRLPTVTLSPMFMVRGLGAGLAGGAAAGAAWGFIARGSNFFGLFVFMLALGVGWAISESISVATNRKRSPILQGFAVIGAITAYLVHNAVIGGAILPSGDVWGYLAAGIAAVFASSRLRA